MADYPIELTLQQCLAAQARQTPDAIALLAPGRAPLTYEQLYRQMQVIGQKLKAMGLGHGDRIAIVLPNGAEMAVTFLAVAIAATSAPLNPAYQLSEFEFYLHDLQAKALIVLASVDSPARTVATVMQIPILEIVPQVDAAAGIFRFATNSTDSTDSTEPGDSTEPVDPLLSAIATPTQPEDVALVLHTSGTTARPKLVPLTQANLCASATHIRTTLQLTASDRCLNVMPLFHIHGLMAGLVASLLAGSSIVCLPEFAAESFFAALAEFAPTWYSAVPTIHQAILADATAHDEVQVIIAKHPLRLIRSSSAALPLPVLQALETQFHAPVIEAYGMTEASHQITSNPLPPNQRLPGSVGIGTGVEVAIVDEQGNQLATEIVGEVVIRGANILQGYEHNPEANTKAFIHGWFRTGDQGYLDRNGYLFLKGRLKEIINRGAEKVSPQEVDEVLMMFPGVAQAIAFAVPHATLGEDVVAAVVPQAGVTLVEAEMRQYLLQQLAGFKVPSQIVVVDKIPQGATGKLQRLGLAQKLAGRLQPEYVTPQDDIERTIAAIFAEVLQIETPGVTDNFFGLGGDSLSGTQVIARINARFGLELDSTVLFYQPTIAELAVETVSAAILDTES